MKTILFSALIFILTFSVGTSLTPEQERAIDNLIEEVIMPANHIPGFGLSIVQDGVTILSKGYGKKDVQNNLDLDENTLFSVGSISKTVVAVLVVKTLSEKFPELGESALDTPIAQLAPDYNFTFIDRYRAESVSFRDLLAHKTCLQNLDLSIIFSGLSSREELMYRTRYLPEVCPFRTGYVYNNRLFILAGDVVAHIAQSGIEKMYLDLMGQIGMSGSWIINSNGDYEYHPNMSRSYVRKQNQTVEFNRALLKRLQFGVAAGGMLTSPIDMTKYMNFHLNKGRVGDKQIVSEAAMNWLVRASNPLVDFTLDGRIGEYSYAVGLFLSVYNGYQLVQHAGYFAPYHSLMSLVPSENLGIFTSANGPGWIDPPYDEPFLHAFIFDLLNGARNGSEISPQSRFPGSNTDMVKIQRTSETFTVKNKKAVDFETVVGLYGNPAHGDLRIDLNSNGTLRFTYGEWGIGNLQSLPGSDTEFLIVWVTDYEDHEYSYGEPIITYTAELGESDTVYLGIGGFLHVPFKRDATLDRFPTIPWAPDSCSPE